jgi:hypothetical protein
MFLSKDLCYIELEKTAVNYIRESLSKNIDNGSIIGAHNFINDEIKLKNPLFIGSIRNPYDWYVSRWSYGCLRKHQDSLYHNFIKRRFSFSRNNNISNNTLKKINFFFNQFLKSTKFWKKLYEDSQNPVNFRIWLKSFLDSDKNNALAEHYFFSSLFNNFGYLTFRYLVMFTNPEKRYLLYKNHIKNYEDLKNFDLENNYINHFIKFENLEEDIGVSLKKIGKQFNNKTDNRNASNRVSNTDYYYDNETKNLVKKYDRLIFEKHHYNL